jgi:hypothetical protein
LQIVDEVRPTSTDKIEAALNTLIADGRKEDEEPTSH